MKKYLLILLIPVLISAQVKPTPKGEKDTSFTLYSTNLKIIKDYPSARLVEKTVPVNVNTYYNIVYTGKGEKKYLLDLFTPKIEKKKLNPAILIIHGGGWRSGDKSMDHAMALKLASMGYVTAVVEYALSTEALYPESVYNIKSAVKWIKENSKKYNINPAEIVLMGTSAGGHLAMLAGVTAGLNKFERTSGTKKTDTSVKAIIDIDGVLDLTSPEESGKDTVDTKPSAVKQWLGVKYKDNRALWIEASPLTYINKNTPPVLFINSSLPRFHAGCDKAVDIMNKFGIYSEIYTIENTPHPFWLFLPWFDEVIIRIKGFLDKVLL